MIRIIIIEDDPLLLENLGDLLNRREGFQVIAMHRSAEDALASTLWKEADVLLVDMELPGISGVELILQARKRHPELMPLAYTIHEDRDTVFAALRAGAYGYVLKGCPVIELEHAIRELVRGGAPMSPPIARRLLDQFLQSTRKDSGDLLSSREISLLRLLSDGLIYKEIGDKLGISPHTVHTHIKNIYGKLHASDRQHALRRARMLGYLDPHP